VAALQGGVTQVGWRNFDQGGRYDATMGLYTYGERDYSPTLGRWMQQDNGGGYVDGANLYLARLGHRSIMWIRRGGSRLDG